MVSNRFRKTSPVLELTSPPPYFPRSGKIFKGNLATRITSPPLIFRENRLEGGGS